MCLKFLKNFFSLGLSVRFAIPYRKVYSFLKNTGIRTKDYLRHIINLIKLKIKEKYEKISDKFNKKFQKAQKTYIEMLSTINYMSPYVKISKKQINKIKSNSNKFYNFLTLKTDKKTIQKIYDKNINPKDLRQANSLLRDYQLKTLELAKEIILPLQKEINFSMNGGTLIGAIRHGGFIPWDDDLDFDLLRDEYDKFEKILKEKYIWANSDICKSYDDYYKLIARTLEENTNQIVCADSKGYIQIYKGTSFADCVFVDFLPWEFVNQKINFKTYKKWWFDFAKTFRDYNLTWGEIDKKYKEAIYSSEIFSTRENCKFVAKHSALSNFDIPKPRKLEKISVFLPFKKHKFEGLEFCMPNDYDKYSKRDYKNWQNIPVTIEFAKHVKAYSEASPKLCRKEYFCNYDEVCKQENFVL